MFPPTFQRAALFFLLLASRPLAAGTATSNDISREENDFFEAKIRPVLMESCYECHSAEAKKVKGGLLLDNRAALLKGGDSGPAMVPGAPDKSLLIEAVSHANEDLAMPPKRRLAEHEIAALRQWIAMGAPDPRSGAAPPGPVAYDWEKEQKHWAYQPVRDPEPPAVREASWARGAIDRFILAKLEEKALRPVGDADKRTLLRRVTYDLTGLPPTPEQLVAFESDGSPQAFENVVDRLLASRHYGERWGRHWMDLVRYADTAGDNSDYPIPQLWRYRNYLIDSFNADKPFNQFLKEQLAGDLLPASTAARRQEQIVATGYVAISRRFGSLADSYPRHLTIEDTLDNMGRVFLGLGLSCARCHNHKFDPIPQSDYYGLYGIFESTRYAFPGIELLKIQKDFVPLLPPEEGEAILRPFNEKAKALQKTSDEVAARRKEADEKRKALDPAIVAAQGGEKEKLETQKSELDTRIEKLRKESRTAAAALEAHQKTRPRLPDAYAVQDGEGKDTAIQIKGEPKRLGEVVPRKFLKILGGQALPLEAAKGSGRLQLAEWIADSSNPLTARVLVNRLWHYHFGSALVGTPNDFGVRGLPPTHPELLDWLASRFVQDGWSLKKLHKRILLSHTYQLASSEEPANLAADPDNHWRWRFNRRRIDAESLRDTLLAVSGDLDWSPLNEPHPFPPPEKWEFTQHFPFKDHYPSRRRTVYLMTARLNALPFFQAFDGPDRNASTASRDSSVTTVQALYFLNSDFFHEQADRFAGRLMDEAAENAARMERAFALIFHRLPSAEERTRLENYLELARGKMAGTEPEKWERAAWASLARALFRTNEFLYLD